MKDGVRARFTLEFKPKAVRLVRGGEKLSSVARTLGVSAQSLDNCVKAEAVGRLRDLRGKALTAEQMEIAGPWSFSPFLLVRNSLYSSDGDRHGRAS